MCTVPIAVPSAVRVGVSVLIISAIRTVPAAEISLRQFNFDVFCLFHCFLLLFRRPCRFQIQSPYVFICTQNKSKTEPYLALFLCCDRLYHKNRFLLYQNSSVDNLCAVCKHFLLWQNNREIQRLSRFRASAHNLIYIRLVRTGKRLAAARMRVKNSVKFYVTILPLRKHFVQIYCIRYVKIRSVCFASLV